MKIKMSLEMVVPGADLTHTFAEALVCLGNITARGASSGKILYDGVSIGEWSVTEEKPLPQPMPVLSPPVVEVVKATSKSTGKASA